jgi:hypothetical protein
MYWEQVLMGIGDGIHNAEGITKIIPNGPDLYVYLTPDKSTSNFVNVGKLKANNGNQNYDIPASRSVEIWYNIDLV